MDLEISGIFDKGTENERVVLRASIDTNLKDYIVIDMNYYGPYRNAEKEKHIFSFPNQEVKKDDIIIIATGPLTNELGYYFEPAEGGNHHYFTFAFKQGYSIWSAQNSYVTLIRVAEYFTHSFQTGRIFASGDGISLDRKTTTKVKAARVIGVMDLGANNAENNFGWTGLKPVVTTDETLFILDFAEEVLILDQDNTVIQSSGGWSPSKKDITTYRLYEFPNE